MFVLFFQGQNTRTKLERLCSSFQANLYPCPTQAGERHALLDDVKTRLSELKNVLDKTVIRQKTLLTPVYAHGEHWKGMWGWLGCRGGGH